MVLRDMEYNQYRMTKLKQNFEKPGSINATLIHTSIATDTITSRNNGPPLMVKTTEITTKYIIHNISMISIHVDFTLTILYAEI